MSSSSEFSTASLICCSRAAISALAVLRASSAVLRAACFEATSPEADVIATSADVMLVGAPFTAARVLSSVK